MQAPPILNLTLDQFNRRWPFMRHWYTREERARILARVYGYSRNDRPGNTVYEIQTETVL